MTDADRLALETDTRRSEGLRLKAYQDTKGVWTIGYGTNLQELTITASTAEFWLARKLNEAENEAQSAFGWYMALTSRRQAAIVELIYNMGLSRLRGFTKFLAAMAAKDYATAHAELLDSKWRTDVGPTRSGRIAEMILNG